MDGQTDEIPYQNHSVTSKEAAVRKNDAGADRLIIAGMIHKSGANGLTNDEISAKLGKNSSFYSPRLIELERAGTIVKLKQTRLTRSNRQANIYVYPLFTLGRETINTKKEAKMPDPMIQETDKKLLQDFIGRVDRFNIIYVTIDNDVYKAIKRLAGI